MTDQSTYEIKKTLDARGLLCPEPVMMLHNAVRDAAVGDVIEVLATDPSTERDIAKFCDFLSHRLVAATSHADEYRFLVQKGT